MPRIGFIGIGAMGAPMAGHISQACYILTLHDILRTNVESVAAQHDGVSIASTQHPSMPSSTESYGSMVVVSGPVGKTIGMNSGGAFGPFTYSLFSGGNAVSKTPSSTRASRTPFLRSFTASLSRLMSLIRMNSPIPHLLARPEPTSTTAIISCLQSLPMAVS